MFADALREVRQHPGRIIATMIAIAISVGFMVATSVFLETEKSGLAKQLNRQYAGSDVVVSRETSEEPDASVLKKITDTPGVAAAEASLTSFGAFQNGDTVLYLQIFGVPSEQFRWSEVVEGTWPSEATEIALPRDVAEKLKVSVGGELKMGDTAIKVTGITNDPASRLMQNGYMSAKGVTALNSGGGEDGGTPVAGQYVVKAEAGTTAEQLADALKPLTVGGGFSVKTTEATMQDLLTEMTAGVNALKYVLFVFAGIALLVGMIIIANTFTILIAQRRRQIGLLRAVGASTEQIRRKFVGEAIVTGILGSLLGVGVGIGIAAIGSSLTQSLYWGLGFPWAEIAIEFGIGVIITVLAALVPIWRTASVAPLEALRPVLNADSQKRVSKVRAVICGVLLAIGAALAIAALTAPVGKDSIAPVGLALGSAFFITFAVLGAAPLYVALLIKGWGKLISFTGPTSRLATMNASRNPQRAAATAVALMLAIGLIITLQVGTATVRNTVLEQIEKDLPVDLVVGMYQFNQDDSTLLPPDVIAKVEGLSNVKSKALVKGGTSTDGGPVLAFSPSMREVAPSLPQSVSDDEALVPAERLEDSPTVTFTTTTGETLTLKGVAAPAAASGTIVSEAVMNKIVAKPGDAQYWVDLINRDDFASTMTQLTSLAATYPNLMVEGGAFQAYLINQILNILLAVTTALLGVAVAIALVGVANTLGLSVIERTRESALLRALGMSRARLRLMLLIEAITLALVGVVVGVVAGVFFAWLGIKSVFRAADIGADARFAIDWTQTLALLVIAVVAAGIASILPGRRAAMATPTEALAVD